MEKLKYKIFRKLRSIVLKKYPQETFIPKIKYEGQAASDIIKSSLLSDEPVMIARFGSLEASCIANYLGVSGKKNYLNYFRYVAGNYPALWWEANTFYTMANTPGLFPVNENTLERFSKMMLEDMKSVDILGSWVPEEELFAERLKAAQKIKLTDLEPYYHLDPWTSALENKKILVIHPFSESISQQYAKREMLFENKKVLPQFTLQTIKAVQSVAGNTTNYTDWFSALDEMKNKISASDFDVAIIGCGAYGFPLAAHVKRIGKKAVHLGGATQILFGIKGKRWEENVPKIRNLMNDYWVRPHTEETPETSNKAENGCYW